MTGRGRGRGAAANQALSPAKVFPSAGPSGAGASSVGSTSLTTISPSAVLGQKQQRLPSIGIEEEVDDDPDLPLVTTSAGAGLTRKPNKITTTSVPAFLNKLFSMVNDPTSNDLIRWSDEGDSFIVSNVDKFGKDILPRFFKHSNFGSFVRQLNMYGFHKVPHLQNGALKQDEGVEFRRSPSPTSHATANARYSRVFESQLFARAAGSALPHQASKVENGRDRKCARLACLVDRLAGHQEAPICPVRGPQGAPDVKPGAMARSVTIEGTLYEAV